MAKKKFKISKEIKEETINRIKNNGISVAQAARIILLLQSFTSLDTSLSI
jgi:DNA polymerase III alpha subunit